MPWRHLALATGLAPYSVVAQQPSAPGERLRLFLDCGRCDFDYIRTAMPFVDSMRDRTDADIRWTSVRMAVTASATSRWTAPNLSIPKRDATEEAIILRLRQLRTDFQWDIRFGLSCRLGSIFNNVVNPRFRRGSGN
ncbi:MAG: hypothetical protein L0271_19880 [Gemmatimonadetes bacterium]|nr:hypothetical protein [Gemmatimonadota bacterium]